MCILSLLNGSAALTVINSFFCLLVVWSFSCLPIVARCCDFSVYKPAIVEERASHDVFLTRNLAFFRRRDPWRIVHVRQVAARSWQD